MAEDGAGKVVGPAGALSFAVDENFRRGPLEQVESEIRVVPHS